ncbi:MAG TPA: hydrogenase 4 subunit F [Pseudobacteroides sp.]|nr:hydrogenase 4 subunit F [Pseudobacteroides sp.]
MEALILIVPLLFSLLFWTSKKRATAHIINIIGAIMLLAVMIYTTCSYLEKGIIKQTLLNGLFYIDSLSLIVLDIILSIGFLVCIYSIRYLDIEYDRRTIDTKKIKIYYSLLYLFIFTMMTVVSTPNLGLMWIAIEATTLSSAFLVGFYNNKHSIEAAWKYIIICSVGIAFALLGIVFLYISSGSVFPGEKAPLDWTFLYQHARALQSGILKISFIFILVGFGTKVGLAPMHTWLPDAHSQAPAPISALLSGVLLNSALYGIIRILSIVNKHLGPDDLYTKKLMIGMGLLSIAAAAIFILYQKDYKRLLAYSSIEHMGIIVFALGFFTKLSIFAAIFHMINHAFTKSMLFLLSGNVYLKYGTKEIKKVNGLLKIMPVTGTLFLLGLFAIAGMPPFSVFFSELSVGLSAASEYHYVLASILLILIAVIFAGIAVTTLKMFYGNTDSNDLQSGEINKPGIAAIIVIFIIITVTGVYMPEPVKNIVDSAVLTIKGGN